MLAGTFLIKEIYSMKSKTYSTNTIRQLKFMKEKDIEQEDKEIKWSERS